VDAVSRARLSQGTTSVEFDFNPNSIKIGHTSDSKSVNRAMNVPQTPSGDGQPKMVLAGGNDVVLDPGDTTITFGEILFEGPHAMRSCSQLLQWTYPEDLSENAQCAATLPVLTFTWDQFTPEWPVADLKVVLTKVDVDFTRFTAQGMPVRATATIGCKVSVSKTKRQNPTSGGPPERTGLRLTDGQNIQGIARQRYGDPHRWRDLAEANGIDDPLRVRPGDLLFLPAPAELGGVSALGRAAR
jgi:hypothetical protein